MKTLLFVIPFLFSLPSFASSKELSLPEMDVTGIVDQELINIERELDEVKIYNKNGTKKVEKLNKVQEHVSELIPKQIKLTKDRKRLNQLIDTKNKYIGCISTKDEEDCDDLKAELDKFELNFGTSYKSQSFIINDYDLSGVADCLRVTRSEISNFKAVITLRLVIGQFGEVIKTAIVDEQSYLSHNVKNFPLCIEHFAKGITFKNSYGHNYSILQKFYF